MAGCGTLQTNSTASINNTDMNRPKPKPKPKTPTYEKPPKLEMSFKEAMRRIVRVPPPVKK